MATEAPWSGIDTSDVPTDEPQEALVPDAPVLEAPADAGFAAPVEGEESQEEVDPDAWRVFRVSDRPAENFAKIRELAETSKEFKRALHSYAAQTVRKESEGDRQALNDRVSQLTRENIRMKKVLGDQMYGNLTPEALGRMVQDPRGKANWDAYQEAKKQAEEQPQEAPAHLISAYNEMADMLQEAALDLSEEEVAQLQRQIDDPKTWAKHANNPLALVRSFDNYLAKRTEAVHNSGVPAVTSPAPAQRRPDQALTPVVRGNKDLSRMAPDGTQRSSGNGRTPRRYTVEEVQNMDPDDFPEILKANNAKNLLDLQRLGVFPK